MSSEIPAAAARLADDRPWRRLRATVARAGEPGLRVEVAPHRILLRQEGRPVLFAVRQAGHQGMWYRRVPGAFRSPVTPPRAQLARDIAGSGAEDERAARWAHWFWRELAVSPDGPVHGGSWLIEADDAMSRTNWRRLGDEDADEMYMSWIPPTLPPVFLRPLSAADSARVKAYRKLAAAGTLPPLLLWWISGLNCDVLLDGHDRLVAAVAEGIAPRVLRLARPLSQRTNSLWLDATIARHEELAAAHAHVPNEARDGRLNRNLGVALQNLDELLGPTLAHPVPGGADGWTAEARRWAPGWNPDPAELASQG